MSLPIVTVICICYNHEKYVEEAILSVLNQTYSNIEIIIIDDASTDKSRQVIDKLKQKYPQLIVSNNEKNKGNCYSFNKGYALSSGEYIIDLATDDVLLENRIEQQVHFFSKQNPQVGVIHANAIYIDEEGTEVEKHFHDIVKDKPVNGQVFHQLLSRYNICPPTMMMKKEVLEELEGYDESLAYEDFDFWIRSSRKWKYAYQDIISTKKRILSTSLSQSFGTKENIEMHQSTIKVCEKAALLVQTKLEKTALSQRINYEWRSALKRKDKKISNAYQALAKRLHLNVEWKTFFVKILKGN